MTTFERIDLTQFEEMDIAFDIIWCLEILTWLLS